MLLLLFLFCCSGRLLLLLLPVVKNLSSFVQELARVGSALHERWASVASELLDSHLIDAHVAGDDVFADLCFCVAIIPQTKPSLGTQHTVSHRRRSTQGH